MSKALSRYVSSQLSALFAYKGMASAAQIESYMPKAMKKVEACFGGIRGKYFDPKKYAFDPMHSDHYAMFLYLLSRTVYLKDKNTLLATKLFLLNKALHAVDAYYEVVLPDVFLFVHPIGTVLGRAEYGNFFAVYQNCSVGADEDGVYPVIGEGVVLYSRSSVIGHCRLGNNVVVGANTFLLDSKVPNNSVVVGAFPNLKIRRNQKPVTERVFKLGAS